MCGLKKMMMGLMVGVFCIAGLPSDVFADMPLDGAGQTSANILIKAKACGLSQSSLENLNDEILTLLNTMPTYVNYGNLNLLTYQKLTKGIIENNSSDFSHLKNKETCMAMQRSKIMIHKRYLEAITK